MNFINIFSIFCTIVVQYGPVTAYVYESPIKIWNKHIEVSAETLRVNLGSKLSLRCDALYSHDPHLRWYGTDRISINGNNRIQVKESFSKRFLQLKFKKIEKQDEGEYICRGWFGSESGFYMKPIRLVVVSPPTTLAPTTTSTQTTRASTTRVVTTTVSTPVAIEEAKTTTTTQPLPATCSSSQFQCSNGHCISNDYVCDSFPDCGDHSDEANCVVKCAEGNVACRTGSECVLPEQVCDNIPQCSDASDEDPDVCLPTTSYPLF
ncbi:Sortilin-related receptor [Mactra antiquata]